MVKLERKLTEFKRETNYKTTTFQVELLNPFWLIANGYRVWKNNLAPFEKSNSAWWLLNFLGCLNMLPYDSANQI